VATLPHNPQPKKTILPFSRTQYYTHSSTLSLFFSFFLIFSEQQHKKMTDSFVHYASHNYYRHKNKKTMFISSTPFSSPSTAFFSPPKPLLRSTFYLRSSTSTSSVTSTSYSNLAFNIKPKDSKTVVSANMISSVSSRTFLNAQNEQGNQLFIN
jgi:hypothetical protein